MRKNRYTSTSSNIMMCTNSSIMIYICIMIMHINRNRNRNSNRNSNMNRKRIRSRREYIDRYRMCKFQAQKPQENIMSRHKIDSCIMLSK